MWPQVDIVITTYNREKILPRAVESVLQQDYSNLFIIIVDDGSTDGTHKYLKTLDGLPNFKIVYHEVNQGVVKAKNSGLDNLSPNAKYFGIFDSDDIMLPGAIKSLVQLFEKHGDSISQVYGWCENSMSGGFSGRFDGDGKLVKFEDAISGKLSGDFWQLFRKDYLGDLRFEGRAASGAMSLVWHSMLKIAPGLISDATVRIYDTSWSDRVSVPKFHLGWCRGKMYSNLAYLEKFETDMLRVCPKKYGWRCLEVSRWAKLAGELRMAIKYFVKGALEAPFASWIPVACQICLPKELVRFLKARKFRTPNGGL